MPWCSSAFASWAAPTDACDSKIVDDIMTDDGVYNFTDGCGEISEEYLAEVAQAMTRQGFSIPDPLCAIQVNICLCVRASCCAH